MTQTLDETIEQVESLYQSVTGQKAPPVVPTPYAAIPPEKDPQVHVGEQIERLLSSLTEVAQRPLPGPIWAPPLWMCHGQDQLLISVDLPGVPRNALRVRVLNGVLEISGTRTPPVTDGQRWSRYAEQRFGAFRRWIPMPGDVAVDRVQAQLKDGVLMVQVPRAASSTLEGKDIEVS
jgi:HSP20 family protein